MKPIMSVLVVMAAALGIVALAIAAGDRQTLVPPPDAVAESFARQMAGRRYALGLRYLSPRLRERIGEEALRRWFDPVRQQLGDVNAVDARLEWIERDRASATASIDAEHGGAVLKLDMVFRQGLWVIDALPADVPVGVRPPARRESLQRRQARRPASAR